MTDIALQDETAEAVRLIESAMAGLSGTERSIWTHTEIDPVVDTLIELWQLFHIPN